MQRGLRTFCTARAYLLSTATARTVLMPTGRVLMMTDVNGAGAARSAYSTLPGGLT